MTNEELLSLLSLDRSSIPPDGGSRFNRLIFSNSPYLLQHAGNPVDWREWSKDAQQEAKARNLPLFVSIGYSTCHWCHVMAHESFEDEEVADILNNAFIPVKVDREERPDIDQFCMAACQALTGSGGWPLNCFIKPDGTPFYATTYLPKEPRQGIPGFLELLENISNVWLHRTDAVERNSSRLMEALSRQTPACAAHSSMTDFKALSDSVKGRMLSMFDREYKGFGSSPKFPMPTWLLFLSGCRETEADTMVVETLMAMRDGGIWDQIGGGIHRYSTDRRWFAPHFEKMLYDQAMVSYACLEAYKHSAETPLLRAAEDILSFAIREMMDRDGGFYSAIDADSEGSEGEFYLWGRNEIESLLKENTLPFMEVFGVSENGNFEHTGKNILQRTISIQMFAEKHGMTTKDAENFIKNCRGILYEARENRVKPLLDRKIISGWNGLMLAALSRAYSTTGNVLYINAALKTKEFIFRELFTPTGRLNRSFMLSASETPGFLEDYTYLTWGLVEFFNATDAIQALEQCERLALEALDLFRMEDGRLSISGKDFEQMPVPLSELHDGVIPSAVSVFAETMLFLYIKTGNEAWKIELERLFHAYSGNIAENPSSCPLFVAVGEKFTELF